MVSEESQSVGRKEPSQPEKKDRQEKSPSGQPKEMERETRDKDREKEKDRERDKEKAAQNVSQGDDFERTPSGRVRRRSAQVAVFHLQEIAEDELAKDWGTKRRIKDDLVPDSKRVRTESGCVKYTQIHIPCRHQHSRNKHTGSIAYCKKTSPPKEQSTHTRLHTDIHQSQTPRVNR